MADKVMSLDEIRSYLMEHIKNLPVRDKKDFIKRWVIFFLRRKQRFSVSVRYFETIFQLELPNHIRKIIMNEKELFDAGKEYNSEAVEQLSIYLVNFSPICENEILHADNMTTAKEVIEQEFFG